ncbi:MAG: helix-turn-helix transcriptional regulator [Candidatus Omnitrophica bacterium]|nr:helix-turn-helix transcriptional regulator [Candidatus Omnitrophota bacterium]
MKSVRVGEHLKDKLKNPAFREVYELDQQKLVIAKLIIRYRIKHNLTQGEFAGKVGVTQQHVSKIESGEFSNMSTLEKMLSPLGLRLKFNVAPLRLRPQTAALNKPGI